MKKLKGVKNFISSFENKKLKNADSIFGGLIGPTNDYFSQASTSQWNCSDIDTYVDGTFIQRQECLTDDCSDPVITKP
ncbi:grasp-with-spasm system A modified peptide [Chryseobacterium sp. ISL-6]|uniref:grasp-with-spasm system A modified peptide n=1 Tax=Chryseobacterium sp. ISL-6 TaxID=2819143 RepID=UPI001BE71366|nr:grasp-with-spasm system A modified peptide [Chryseobacterium sp. ISL-6]MBT2623787.1 grasp-with-spasm system A modified peptide [Chryseobacterium sp. ISL-6]